MNTLAPSFLIGSSSFLQVMRTCMKAWMSSNFGKFATELRPLIGGRTGLVVRASVSGSGDLGLILGRVGVLFP